EAALEFSEVSYSEKQQKRDYPERDQLTGPKQRCPIAEYAPAKSVDDADDRIERVDGAKHRFAVGHVGTADPDGRHVEAKLDHKRNDVNKIAVLDVERGKPHPNADRAGKSEQQENRNEHNLPAGSEVEFVEVVKHHHHRQQTRGHREVDEADHDAADRQDHPWKIYLGDHVAVADQAVAARGQA